MRLAVAGLMLALSLVALGQTVVGTVIRPLAARGTDTTR